ncbi:MAG: hypothetical protein ACOX69_09325 [Coriobacteriales bacterium]
MQRFVMTSGFMTGKTTWIERMLRTAGIDVPSTNPALANVPAQNERRLRVGGVYTPAVFEGEKKVAIDAVLLPSLERLRFADAQPWFSGVEGGGDEEHGAARGDGKQPKLAWDFSDAALERVNAHLSTCTDCDLLLIDELGPLELLRGGGFTEGMRLLDTQSAPASLVVVRPALTEEAERRWGAFDTLTPDSSVEEFLARVTDAAK